MNFNIEDNMDIDMSVDDEDISLDVGDTINIGTKNYEELTNKPSIEGKTLEGEMTLADIDAYTKNQINDFLANKANAGDLAAVATSGSYNDLKNKPNIPAKTSDLDNDSGFITEDDIPPLVTNLGYIDPEPYEEDLSIFLNTLTESGFYTFTFGGGDFTFFVQVQSFGDSSDAYVNQHFWSDEENPATESIRGLHIEDGEVVDEVSSAYMTYDQASIAFATKSHTHYRTANGNISVWDYCGTNIITNDSPILYTDNLNSKQYLIETWQSVRLPVYQFQRVTDLQDASVIYQRSGEYSNGNVTWGEWKEFHAATITVNGTNYPITAITQTSISGVQGVLVDYDDGNSGQLFFADGVGLNTIKTAIEGTIPHDTSELTNGAGFITISDLPIYNGGVQ